MAAARTDMPDEGRYAESVDEVCAEMNRLVSPGHHILVLDEQGRVLIRSRHVGAGDMEGALLAAGPEARVFDVGDHRAAQYRLRAEGQTIVVAQYLDRMESILRRQLVSRATVTGALALAIILLLVWLLNLWLVRPLNRLLRSVRRWSARDFGVRSPPTGPAEMRFLAAELNVMAERLGSYEARQDAEFAKARAIRAGLLPRELPEVRGLRVAARYEPVEHIAGDLYDVLRLPDGRVAFAVLDVCGHGLSAALLTGAAKMSLHWRLAEEADLPAAMARVNADLAGCLTDGQFVTACVGVWDRGRGTWTYCAAGHPGGIHAGGRGADVLPSTGPLLGVIEAGGGRPAR